MLNVSASDICGIFMKKRIHELLFEVIHGECPNYWTYLRMVTGQHFDYPLWKTDRWAFGVECVYLISLFGIV